jgi:hypothetical protein
MSPNGNLLAYSTPVNIKELRDQAALVSAAWKESCSGRHTHTAPDPRKDSAHPQREPSAATSLANTLKPALETLTIEAEHCNILVRSLQPELLFVMVGEIPPNRRQAFKITPEGKGEPRYPASEETDPRPGSSAAASHSVNLAAGSNSLATESGSSKVRAPSIMSTMSQRERDVKLGALHIQRKRLDALTAYIKKDFEASGFVMPSDWALQ